MRYLCISWRRGCVWAWCRSRRPRRSSARWCGTRSPSSAGPVAARSQRCARCTTGYLQKERSVRRPRRHIHVQWFINGLWKYPWGIQVQTLVISYKGCTFFCLLGLCCRAYNNKKSSKINNRVKKKLKKKQTLYHTPIKIHLISGKIWAISFKNHISAPVMLSWWCITLLWFIFKWPYYRENN